MIEREFVMTEDEYKKLYEEKYEGVSFTDIIKDIDSIKDVEEQEALRSFFCDDLLYRLTGGYTKYYEDTDYESLSGFKLFLENVEKLNQNRNFLWSIYFFYKKDYKQCFEYIKKCLDETFEQWQKEQAEGIPFMTEYVFIVLLLEPFKNAYDGFWVQISELLDSYSIEKDTKDYCKLISQFYSLQSQDDVIDLLIKFNQQYPNYYSVLELLGYMYQEKKMWRNAIRYFEKAVEDELSILFPLADIYFRIAWCYGKCRGYKQEELYYRKSVELDRYGLYSLNNLGYCLYKQKKYVEAKGIFEECLDKKKDVECTANNYVRVLIALGRNRDAKEFIKKGEFRVVKALRDKVAKLECTNARINKSIVVEDVEEEAVETKEIDFVVKRQQFSSEKLLEDELTLRLEAGKPVFGLNLHIYNHKGDFYGRQYPFEMGRLDKIRE